METAIEIYRGWTGPENRPSSPRIITPRGPTISAEEMEDPAKLEKRVVQYCGALNLELSLFLDRDLSEDLAGPLESLEGNLGTLSSLMILAGNADALAGKESRGNKRLIHQLSQMSELIAFRGNFDEAALDPRDVTDIKCAAVDLRYVLTAYLQQLPEVGAESCTGYAEFDPQRAQLELGRRVGMLPEKLSEFGSLRDTPQRAGGSADILIELMRTALYPVEKLRSIEGDTAEGKKLSHLGSRLEKFVLSLKLVTSEGIPATFSDWVRAKQASKNLAEYVRKFLESSAR